MTTTVDAPPLAPPAEPPAVPPAGFAPAPAPLTPRSQPGVAEPGAHLVRAIGTSLSILAVVLLGFVSQMTVLGSLAHQRAQKVAYANFRAALAQATAPVGHFGADGEPLAAGTAVAVLTVPRIGLREVVFEGTGGGVLKHGPGHRRDTAFPGQPGVSVLMGRRAAYGGPFARIGELSGGDRISVVTGQGEHTYEVIGVRRSGEPQPAALAAGAGRLTLATGDGQAFLPQDVLRVDAQLTSPAQDTTRLAIVPAALPRTDQVMAIEPIALVPLVLWGQLLLAAALGTAWLRQRLGPWHAWLIGLPVLVLLGVLVAGECARLLPNLL